MKLEGIPIFSPYSGEAALFSSGENNAGLVSIKNVSQMSDFMK
jgi:hypothetical protein